MDRRTFIQSTMAIAAAAAIPFAAHAMAAHSPFETKVDEIALPKAHPYQRYITALSIFDELVAIHERGILMDKDARAELASDLHLKFDELLGYVHENFVPPSRGNKAARRQCSIAFDSGYTDSVTGKWVKVDTGVDYYASFRRVPPIVMEEVWPALMAKVILRDYSMPINHRKLTQFKTFHDRYGFMILEG